MANPQCLNTYTCCLNNPLKYTDPSGFTNIEIIPAEVPYLILWQMNCDDVTASTITADNGNTTTVVTQTNNPSEILATVVQWGNQERQKEGDTQNGYYQTCTGMNPFTYTGNYFLTCAADLLGSYSLDKWGDHLLDILVNAKTYWIR